MMSTTSGNRIDIKAFIDERPISPYQWLLVVLCFLIVTADGMDVAIMGFVAPSIIHDWAISRPEFGLVMSAAPIGLVIGALFAGPASDRIGRKWVLITSVFLFGVFTIATAFFLPHLPVFQKFLVRCTLFITIALANEICLNVIGHRDELTFFFPTQ